MTFWEMLSVESAYLLRVLVALLLGLAIGIERKIRHKEAGMRTHAIVCAGAALMTVVGKYGFGAAGDVDGSRIAAQIVTGIGFLGAGVIMYRRDSVCGITTAAGIWMTAGIGIAAGAGQYVLASGTTVLVIILQCVLHLHLPHFQMNTLYIYRIKFTCADNESERIKKFFGITNFNKISYYHDHGQVKALAVISTNCEITDENIKEMVITNDFITSLERIYHLDELSEK